MAAQARRPRLQVMRKAYADAEDCEEKYSGAYTGKDVSSVDMKPKVLPQK